MEAVYVYAGTFAPPTRGHISIIRQAAAILPALLVVCSENPNKTDKWFTPDQCKAMFAGYSLPRNVTVLTLAEFKQLSPRKSSIVLIRGLRDASDCAQEQAVMMLNREQFGITKYFYIFGADKYRDVSSTAARQAAEQLDLRSLYRLVSPLVISALLEKVLRARNIFLVVGQPGSGKSTFLDMLHQLDGQNYVIKTDEFNKQLRPLLQAQLGEGDLIKLATDDEARLKKAIVGPWFELLRAALRTVPAGANVLVEVAYGLQTDKLILRFLGGKVIYLGCGDDRRNLERVIARGTPELAGFISRIPGRAETMSLAKKYKLALGIIDTDCSLETLRLKAGQVNSLITGGKNVYDL
ncbi:MAG: adenylyltransferase/cytidyltransferase family protein [Candidatus Falkowbacteria bacterium]